MTPTYTLTQLREAAAAADYGYEEFCRRLGADPGGTVTGTKLAAWINLRASLRVLDHADLAALLADDRPWDASDIMKAEG